MGARSMQVLRLSRMPWKRVTSYPRFDPSSQGCRCTIAVQSGKLEEKHDEELVGKRRGGKKKHSRKDITFYVSVDALEISEAGWRKYWAQGERRIREESVLEIEGPLYPRIGEYERKFHKWNF